MSFAVVAHEHAGLDLLGIDERLARRACGGAGLLRHFEREDGDDLAAADRGVLRDVDGPGRLSHRGARGDDDELGVLQSAGHAVEFVEVGCQPGDLAAFLIKVVDGAERIPDNLRDPGEAARNAFFRDLQQIGLGSVQDVERIFALVGGPRDRHRADVDQLPQQRLVLDDADVFFNRKAPRQSLGQRRKIRNSADRFDFLALGQLLGERDDVDGPACIHQFADAREDALVGLQREIGGYKLFCSLVVGVIIQQDSAEDRSLGVN